MTDKMCPRCGKTKPLTDFQKNKNRPDGLQFYCRVCTSKANGRSSSPGVRGPNHGESKTPLYRRWKAMNDRCHRPTAHNYKWYGGKGVFVCDAWRGTGGYLTFKDWAIGSGYAPGLQLDRVDSEGPYSPENCQWLTPRQNIKKMWAEKSIIRVGGALAKTLHSHAAKNDQSIEEFIWSLLSLCEEHSGSSIGGE